MTKYYLKKRIDIIVEAPLIRTLTNTLDQAQVPGYSVLPILEGRGMLNAWSSEGQISAAANMVALLCIAMLRTPTKWSTPCLSLSGAVSGL